MQRNHLFALGKIAYVRRNFFVTLIHRLYSLLFRVWRPRRWAYLTQALELNGTESALDVGGTISFWRSITNTPRHLVVVNLDQGALRDENMGIHCILADGCALPFQAREFDFVFSNSVIEHVGSWDRQLKFAEEARRVGVKLWVQTPAREFPLEPHFLTLAIHWMPERVRPFVARWFSIRGWIEPEEARNLAQPGAIRLLGYREMVELFPDCIIYVERFLGLPKSYVAMRKGGEKVLGITPIPHM